MEIKKKCARWFSRRGALALIMALIAAMPVSAQSAKQILDKTAAVVSAKQGAQANFAIVGQNLNTSGTIAIKGRMFRATTPQAIVWYDGKTQWTYMKKNDEVNVATPNEAQQAAINPYNFIYMYKNGYKYTTEKKGSNFVAHLTANTQKYIVEMFITIDQKSYIPSQVRYRTAKGWTNIEISNFKQMVIPDGTFRFNAKEYPNAEVIDLR
jgi:outer membrane lipoprotein-sorting protein